MNSSYTASINDIAHNGLAKPEEDENIPEMKHTQGTLKELWGDKNTVVNLCLMSVLWSVCSFTYYLGKFQLKYVAGSVWRNSVFSSIADIVARPMGYFLYIKLSVRKSLFIVFALSTLGSFPVIFSVSASEAFKTYVVPVCLFTMNLGTSSTFGNLYLGHLDLFPIVFSSTAMGIVNISARTLTVFAPIVAEIEQPIPEIIFTSLSLVAVITTLFIRDKTLNFY